MKLADVGRQEPRHCEETTERLILEAVHSDTTAAEIVPAPIGSA